MKIRALTLSFLSLAILAGCKDDKPQTAKIVMVDAVMEQVKTPKQVCENVTVTHQRAPTDQHKVVGTVTGGTAGGVIGHQIGGGHGKDIATAVGAIAGAAVGRHVQGNMQQNDTYTTTQKKCHTEYTTSEKQNGYNVTYEFNGQQQTIQMKEKPTVTEFPVVDGKVYFPQS
ncbi:MAG: glycine zipper 2TM domain-containing protein [Vibrio sp.]